jgi:hypothetical protein
MIKRKENKKTINDQIIDSLFVLFPFDHWVFVFCFLLIIDNLCVLFPFNHLSCLCSVSFWQKETEQKDYQWSKGNRTQRLSMVKRKQNKNTSVSFWSLIIFVFCFLLIIDSLFALYPFVMFPFDHWRMNTSYSTNHARCVTEHTDYRWWKGNKTKRLSMIKRKHSTKDYQWSKLFLFCFLLIIDSPFVLFHFDHW